MVSRDPFEEEEMPPAVILGSRTVLYLLPTFTLLSTMRAETGFCMLSSGAGLNPRKTRNGHLSWDGVGECEEKPIPRQSETQG